MSSIFSDNEKPVPGLYNEILKFSIEVKGISMGSIIMRTVKTGPKYLQINANVESFDSLKGIYYVAGNFGAMWDYQKRKSYMAFEDVYDGYSYHRRAYRFQDDNKILVNLRESRFSDAGYPHSEKPTIDNTKEYFIDNDDYQDLIGVFFFLRTSGMHPKPGDVYRLKVLPAGVKQIMIVQVVDVNEMNVPALGGKRKVVHVKSGLANPDQKSSGGNIFFNVRSPLDMYFTDDEDSIPLRISAKLPIIQTADVVLTDYKQIKKKKSD